MQRRIEWFPVKREATLAREDRSAEIGAFPTDGNALATICRLFICIYKSLVPLHSCFDYTHGESHSSCLSPISRPLLILFGIARKYGHHLF
jgi:hypothetical protein